MQLSWGIYQTRIVREQKRDLKIIGKKDATWKEKEFDRWATRRY